MSVAKPIPPVLLEWAQSVIGTVHLVRDVSHGRGNSRVWQLTYATGIVFAKLAPSPKSFSRDTRALREVVPGLEPGTAPLLLAADPLQLALLLSPVSGRTVKSLSLAHAEQRMLHRQAGSWLRRFHGSAGELSAQDHADADAEIARTAAGGEKHLDRAGNLIGPEDRRTVRWHAAALGQLGQLGQLPAGYVHGDFQERNWLLDTGPAARVFGAVDLERARPHAAVADLVLLACGSWVGRPDLQEAFFEGYGRALTAEEQWALRCLSVLDAASAISWGVPNGDDEIVERGRATLARLEVQAA
ncbi:aminoglycoside phosphotransferase family protein [Streptomyces sporangiiformans]|uniref:Aminoglycoside phosphotransferase family protein n=1 Tax=Streptomyces sporangiiformans TaxID=2315329 RepID=A0A505D9U3_9ACTN|nr:aminoglycoside phosphotransferase family protein [Streptomyces sporangiiformans]TPQ21253.1 aminoglycoside phosphotransferase family protein [Streptomyces sporangiiformans]